MHKIELTGHQLFSLSACGAIGGSIIVIGSTMATVAKQDAWIGALFSTLFGMAILWIYWYLGSNYPEETFVGIIKKVFGKWIGTFFAASYIFLCFNLSFHIPWYISHHLTTQVMPETPAITINTLFVAAIVVAVLYGLETIARFSEIAIYFVLILFFLAMALVSPNVSIDNIFPIFEKGIVPSLKSSALLSCFTLYPLTTVLMIYPLNIQNIKNARKQLLKGFLWCNLLIFVAILMCILVLGSTVTANYQFPTYLLAKQINVATIFSRVEFVITLSWFTTQFVIGALSFYACIMGISELLGLKEHKRIVIPLGLLVLVFSEVVFPDIMYQINWVNMVWIPYSTTHGLILPISLFVIFQIKKKLFKKA